MLGNVSPVVALEGAARALVLLLTCVDGHMPTQMVSAAELAPTGWARMHGWLVSVPVLGQSRRI